MKKYLPKICVGLIMVLSILPSFASSNLLYQDEAKILYELNLYKGVSEVKYEPDLESNLTREQAAVILVRLFGAQDKVKDMSNGEVRVILAGFMDSGDISDWAKKEVAYGIKEGYIKGIQKEDGMYFNPQGDLKGIDYASLILQQLGVTDFKYQESLQKLVAHDIITKTQQQQFNKQQLIRDDVVGMSYSTLKAKNGEFTVIENLVKLGKVEKDKAIKFGLIEEIKPEPTQESVPTASPEPSKEPAVTTTPTPIPTKESNLKRADDAIKLGQWTLSNRSKEKINIEKIYLSAVYGGQVKPLKQAYVTDYSIEDTKGNVYATFSDLSETDCIDLSKFFELDAARDGRASEKDICLYAKIHEGAAYGGTIEIFLGDGTNIFEATGAITGTKVVKTGGRIAQEDGEKTISISKILPKEVSYERNVMPGVERTVAVFNLQNEGSKGVLLEKVRLKELANNTGNNVYSLKNELMETISTATAINQEIIFNIVDGERISATKSKEFSVIMDDEVVNGNTVQLKLMKEGTSYDSLKNEGYSINIDDDLKLGKVIVKD